MKPHFKRREFMKAAGLGAASLPFSGSNTFAADTSAIAPDRNTLFKKVYGTLIGAAVGDAMGGPVEFWDFPQIEEKYGILDRLLPYERELSTHGPWAKTAGTYTDDTRMNKLFCQAIIDKGGVPTDSDLARTFADYYYSAPEGLPKQFIEEYYLKGIYREEKQVFGGQPTNGAIMGIAPWGVINACNPRKALRDVFNGCFSATGYALYSSGIAAAAIASAMKPGATVDGIIADSLDAVKFHKSKVEGHRWASSHMYPDVGMKNENMMQRGIEIAKKHGNPYSLKQELYDMVLQQFFADASETLTIAVTMLYAANGDYVETVKGAVNYGRDNDSSASVAGAITGALNGVEAIPSEWIETVEKVNPAPTFRELAEKITGIIIDQYKADREILENLGNLIEQS